MRFTEPLALTLLLVVAALAVVELRTRGSNRGRRRIAVGLRAATLILVACALAGLETTGPVSGTTTIFLVDLSASVRETSEIASTALIQQAAEEMDPADRAGIVVFGNEALVESSPISQFRHEQFDTLIDGSGTDIERAILRGLSMLPSDSLRRIVLITDGIETSGNARAAAAVAANLGVPIDVLPLASPAAGYDVAIVGVDMPLEVSVGQSHTLSVLIDSQGETVARLYILRDGLYLGEDLVELRPGENRVTYESVIDSSGVHRYEFLLDAVDDETIENNEYTASLRAKGEPSILYVSKPGEPSRALVSALSAQGIRATVIEGVGSFPTTLSELLRFEAVVFDNVPAYDLSFSRMQMLERYVRDLGGGFLMIGGDTSFGIGGYFDTPVERILPVDMDVTSSMDMPSLALVMVVDKSGSMGDTIASGETKLDLVKEAVIASVEVLNPFYTVGLLAFDADAEWTIPPTRAGNREQIVADMSGLAPGGGTQLFPAMSAGFEGLRETQAAVKHMLVLSDGLTDDGDFEQLVDEMSAEKVTVSTIAVGSDSDRDLLEMIADRGGGRNYYTDDIEQIPRIFASESIIVSRGLIVEEQFIPQPSERSDIVDGIDLFALPPLDGFVLAYTKQAATQVLTTFNDNPLLATWQYGLGRAAAFTSDLGGRWADRWLSWEQFPQFTGQLVRWLQRPVESSLMSASVAVSRGSGTVDVDVIDADGNFVNSLTIDAIILSPSTSTGSSTTTVSLEQTEPGHYATEFEASAAGDYFVTVYDTEGRYPPVTRSTSIPYPMEFVPRAPDTGLLSEVARLTGGRLIREAGAELSLERGPRERSWRGAWRELLMLALIVFIGDIAYRQIAFRNVESTEADARDRQPGIRGILDRIRGKREALADVTERMERSFREEAERKRDLGYWFGRDAREIDRRLYLAKRFKEKTERGTRT